MTENLGDSDDGEILGVNNNVASGGAHALSSGSKEAEGRVPSPKRFDQLRAIHVAGGFARRDQDLHEDIVLVRVDALDGAEELRLDWRYSLDANSRIAMKFQEIIVAQPLFLHVDLC
jgi:hypothetical protein